MHLFQTSGEQAAADALDRLSVQSHEWKKYKDSNNHPNR
jgi:hypothetical protein